MGTNDRRAGRGLRAAAVLAGLGVLAPAATASSVTAPRIGSVRPQAGWGRAIEVPGLGALNVFHAEVRSVSCASAGNCAAGGIYTDRRGRIRAFVVSQRRGVWRRAIGVPGLDALNPFGSARVLSVSCASAGSCAAGGWYKDHSGHQQGFVVSQRRGVWRRAIEVPSLGALNAGGSAEVSSVSCASAGNCAAAGDYTDASGQDQGFVVSERRGVWRRAFEVPGLGALNAGGSASVGSVSCGSAGNCAAGGSYQDRSGDFQAFVVSERRGVWGQASALNAAGQAVAGVLSVSCGLAGSCVAGGAYQDDRGVQGFVVSQQDGVWSQAIEVPGLGALNAGGSAQVLSVSCGPAGNCAAAGDYTDASGHVQGFVVSQRNGV